MEIDLKDYKKSEIYHGNVDISNLEILKTFKVIDGYVNINYSNLENFKDFKVEIVTGYFYCCNCKNLKSLESSLKIVYESFSCTYCNNLEDLEGLPIINGNFYCWELPKLNIKKSIASILNSGVPFEKIGCESELKAKLQIAKDNYYTSKEISNDNDILLKYKLIFNTVNKIYTIKIENTVEKILQICKDKSYNEIEKNLNDYITLLEIGK